MSSALDHSSFRSRAITYLLLMFFVGTLKGWAQPELGFSGVDAALAGAITSGGSAVEALAPESKANSQPTIAFRQRAVFAEALDRLRSAREDPARMRAAQVDILRSLLTAVESESRRESAEKIDNRLPDLQAAIWTTYVEPLRRNAEKIGLVPLSDAEGKPVGRWYDTHVARAVSVFELFADVERKTLTWLITDIDDRRSAVAKDVVEAVKMIDPDTRPSKLVVYLETSGLEADAAVEGLRAVGPTRLRVIAEDVAAVVDSCVARAKAPPLPAAKPVPDTDGIRGAIVDQPPVVAASEASGEKAATATDNVPDAPPASPTAKGTAGKAADAAPKPPVFDEQAARQRCERQVASVSTARDVAVIVDPRRQIGVWSARLMLQADVERAAALAASLVKDWP